MKQSRIRKEDLDYCKVEYFNGRTLVDVIRDKFDSLSEAVNRSNKNYDSVVISCQDTGFCGEYRVSKNKNYRRTY